MNVNEEEDYESDPEQSNLSLTLRRRTVASDDEDELADVSRVVNSRVSDSDYDSDEQGAAEEYYDDDEDGESRVSEVIEEVEVEVEEFDGVQVVVGEEIAGSEIEKELVKESVGEGVVVEEVEVEVEKKKKNEPFAVPTAGAFYMHDDRFRGSVAGRGRNRRTLGGKKLWESRDERKWGHDKFEEMTMHERPYGEGRRVSRGRNRVRGRNKGEDREYLPGNRYQVVENNNQDSAIKSVRGKGPRRYRPVTKNYIEDPANNRRPTKFVEKGSNASTGRASVATSTSESAQSLSRKNTFASSLSSASPPFYPSGTSNQEVNSTPKKDAQINNSMQRKSVSNSLGLEKLYINDPVSSNATKQPNKLPPPTFQARNKGRGQAQGQMTYQPVPPQRQTNRISSQNQVQAFQKTPVQNRSAGESPPKVSGPTHVLESTEISSPQESYNSKTAFTGKGKGGLQGNGMGSFPYGGNHSDQNFPFLPVMQFAGQHPGGVGVPAVGMAFPGYVGQPNGMGNSEMTWLPVLAGAARGLGASRPLGAAYGSPYITMDATYHAQTAGPASSFASASNKDSNTNEPGNNVKLPQRSEIANADLGQRQNKARRYVFETSAAHVSFSTVTLKSDRRRHFIKHAG